MKKAFVLYSDFKETLDKLPDEDAGKLFKLIVDYANNIERNPENLIIDLVFTPIKLQMQRDQEKYEIKAEASRNNGKAGGRPKKTQQVNKKPKETQQVISEPRKPDTDTVTDIVTDTEKETEKEKQEAIKRFNKLINQKDPPCTTWTKEYLKHQLHQISLERPDLFDRDLFNQFYKYWKESMGHGKIRVNSQKAFDIRRRLSTWKRNNQNKAPFKQQQVNIPQQTAYSRAWDSFKTNKS